MPFLLLLFLVLTCLPPEWPEPPEWIGGPVGSVAVTLTLMGGLVVGAGLRSGLTARRLRTRSGARDEILDRYSRFRNRHVFALMGAYLLALGVLGYGGAVQALWSSGPKPEDLWFAGELVRLAPFLAAWLLSWAMFYNAERAAYETSGGLPRRPFMSRWTYVGLHARQYLALTSLPIVLLVVEQGVERWNPELFSSLGVRIGLVALSFIVLMLMPLALRLILGLRPLPAGIIRDRLEAMARRLKFRYSDILLWDTYGNVANAMVTGLLPWPRYVLLSDRLLDELSLEEIEAVFGHEIGHVKHGHMPYYMAFLSFSLLVLCGFWALADQPLRELMSKSWLEVYEGWGMVPGVLAMAGYVFVAFGMLSRRCERQADIFGCRSVAGGPEGVRTFARALVKVTEVNGVSVKRPGRLQSWLHSTTAKRVEFLERMIDEPGLEPRFQRRLGWVKWGVLVGLAGVLIALGTTAGWNKLLGGL